MQHFSLPPGHAEFAPRATASEEEESSDNLVFQDPHTSACKLIDMIDREASSYADPADQAGAPSDAEPARAAPPALAAVKPPIPYAQQDSNDFIACSYRRVPDDTKPQIKDLALNTTSTPLFVRVSR
jgi:hypothetical protein